MIYHIHEMTPHKKQVTTTVEILEQGGVIVYPTDTVYSYGCDINNKQALEKICRLKERDHKKPFSIILSDLRELHEYTRNVSKEAFKIIKKGTPGPYTFIFQASKEIPKNLLTKQKTVGIRIPNSAFIREVVASLGRPVISSSVDTREGSYIVEPSEIEKEQHHLVDLTLDAGSKESAASTIVDFSNGTVDIIREGKGSIFF